MKAYTQIIIWIVYTLGKRMLVNKQILKMLNLK